MTGRVCEKHGCWCPDGECRWCEPAANSPEAQLAQARDALACGLFQVTARELFGIIAAASPGCYRRYCTAPVIGTLKHPYARGGEVSYCAEHSIASIRFHN